MNETVFIEKLAHERACMAADYLHAFSALPIPPNATEVHFSFVMRYDDGNTAILSGVIDQIQRSQQPKKKWWRFGR